MPTRLHRSCNAFWRLDGRRLGPLSAEEGLISSFRLTVGAGTWELLSLSLVSSLAGRGRWYAWLFYTMP